MSDRRGIGLRQFDRLANAFRHGSTSRHRRLGPPLVAEPAFGNTSVVERARQATFKLRLLKAYQGRCAVTGEHAVPVLDAAHIQPYMGPGSNHLQNGMLLRADLYRLYDAGYVTLTPELRLEVSRRLKDEFDNGRTYYELAGQTVQIPAAAGAHASPDALRWHAEHVFG